jgi:hypothetical protein
MPAPRARLPGALEPERRTDPLVQCLGAVEVAEGLLPRAEGPGQEAHVVAHGAVGRHPVPHDDHEIGVRLEEAEEQSDLRLAANGRHRRCQCPERRDPVLVPWKVVEPVSQNGVQGSARPLRGIGGRQRTSSRQKAACRNSKGSRF